MWLNFDNVSKHRRPRKGSCFGCLVKPQNLVPNNYCLCCTPASPPPRPADWQCPAHPVYHCHPGWLHTHHVHDDGHTVSWGQACMCGRVAHVVGAGAQRGRGWWAWLTGAAVGQVLLLPFVRGSLLLLLLLLLLLFPVPPAQQGYPRRAAAAGKQPRGLPLLVCLHHILFFLRAQPLHRSRLPRVPAVRKGETRGTCEGAPPVAVLSCTWGQRDCGRGGRPG